MQNIKGVLRTQITASIWCQPGHGGQEEDFIAINVEKASKWEIKTKDQLWGGLLDGTMRRRARRKTCRWCSTYRRTLIWYYIIDKTGKVQQPLLFQCLYLEHGKATSQKEMNGMNGQNKGSFEAQVKPAETPATTWPFTKVHGLV